MTTVEDHYSSGDLGERILAALVTAGVDLDALTIDDLAPADAFHIRGRKATEELASAIHLQPGQLVLDAGCGIGGTSRYLAANFGCDVVGVDLTPEYCEVAQMLSQRVGLDDRTSFRQGSVLELPFEDDHFDVVWTEHVQMNIADKAGFYGELYRVLAPGGLLAFHDVFAGPDGDLHFPVPWASHPSISHLIPIEDLRGVLGAAGFSQFSWEDKTGASTEFFEELVSGPPPAVGLQLLIQDAHIKIPNILKNLQEGRVCVVQALMKKPSGNRTLD
jgi:SAM-dependent methyltransferase